MTTRFVPWQLDGCVEKRWHCLFKTRQRVKLVTRLGTLHVWHASHLSLLHPLPSPQYSLHGWLGIVVVVVVAAFLSWTLWGSPSMCTHTHTYMYIYVQSIGCVCNRFQLPSHVGRRTPSSEEPWALKIKYLSHILSPLTFTPPPPAPVFSAQTSMLPNDLKKMPWSLILTILGTQVHLAQCYCPTQLLQSDFTE